MKNYFNLAFMLLLCSGIFAQNLPDCSHLAVQDISLNTATNKMDVTLMNNCANCASGLNGCVYWEMKVIRMIAPFDTLGASKCWCLQSPNNGTQKTYSLTSTVSSLPSLGDLRVSLMCGSSGCDTIPFGITTGLNQLKTGKAELRLFPNPATDHISIGTSQENTVLKLIDISGKIVVTKELKKEDHTIDISQLEKGIYIAELYDTHQQILRSSKITKN